MFEFKAPDVPPHKCSTLDTVKVSNTRTNLVCRLCKQVVGWWDDTNPAKKYPEDASFYNADTLDKLR